MLAVFKLWWGYKYKKAKMSEEQLKAFIAKVQADTSLQEQLKAEGADVVAIAKAAGFAITEAEVKAYGETRDLLEKLGLYGLESVRSWQWAGW